MGSTPDRLRQETEDTRAHLSDSVDRLAERLSPPRVARRRASAVRARAATARDRVMGTARATARQTGDTAGQARAQAQGSPLAAGAIAFGAGLLVGALFPPTDAETRVGQRVRNHADDLVGPVRETAREAGAELREPAREAASSVKDKAQEAARSTARQARTSE
ncbi:DUF3618 domain-containing protein [Streptomyces spectabilis]|uniref:DUF3618 domain-containing protein n=1 Tax=Streptomyces spectabilis TaxID=68270 RepID=UPI0033FB1166